MKIIKLGIISLVFFALFLTLLSLFFPSHIRISKAIDIRAEKDSAMALLGDVRNWKRWYPGADTAVYIASKGKIIGIRTRGMKGLVIKEITDSSVAITDADPDPKKGEGGWNIFPGNTPHTFTVQWYMDFHLRWYPWEKFSGLLLEKRYGPMMEQGLEKLKKLLEK